MSNQLPPRERGLQPTHFIEVCKDRKNRQCVSGVIRIPDGFDYTAAISFNTIAIFKIYPKVEFNVRQLPPITNTSLFWVTIKTTH